MNIEKEVSAISDAIGALIAAAYDAGAKETRKNENANGTTEYLKQIDRMARQIEECHSTIRRRNEEIRLLAERNVKLHQNQCTCSKECCK